MASVLSTNGYVAVNIAVRADTKLCGGAVWAPGRMFHLKPLPESESHSERRIRDTVSACGPVGKVHPALRARSGTQFPFEARSGNGVPLWGRNLEYAFRRHSADSQHDKRRGPIPAIRGQALALEQSCPALTSRQTKST